MIAIDKPADWMLVPFDWQRTQRNLQAAITSSIRAGDFWARSRGLKFLKNIHRLDAETTGILLLGKSPGAVSSLGELFESRRMEKRYLAIVEGGPRKSEWTCEAGLAPEPGRFGRVRVDPDHGKEAVTSFRVLARRKGWSLIEARPLTGRTHQIRVHLMTSGHPIVGDPLYGTARVSSGRSRWRPEIMFPMGLRAVSLGYRDPFRRRRVTIQAPTDRFLDAFGFGPEEP